MVYLLVYKDGTEQVVERCFIVHYRHSKTKRYRERFCAQSKPGKKLLWLKPRELERVESDYDPKSKSDPPERRTG